MYFVDMLGNNIFIPSFPKRIISLVPSQTELLFDLGLNKAMIGGTKKFHFETIDKLQPDLIIGNKEENYLEGVEKLKKNYPVWISDVRNLS